MTDRKHNIFVGRIDSRVSKGELGDLFRPYGKIASMFIANQNPGAQFTYGFVSFENEDDSALAISKLNGISFHGQRLKVELGTERNNQSNKTSSVQNHRNARRPWNFRSNEPRNASSIHHPSNFRNEEEDQLVWNSDTNGRNDHLNHLTNIYSEVVQSPLLPDGGATLPDLLQWLLTIDRLPLTNGPVYNQKKPKCFLDLDALDDLAEAYWSEKKEKTCC